MSDLEIFQLAGAIALALKGEKEAIADIELLLQRHPEMFENAKDVVNTINEVVSNPEYVIEAKRKEAILVAKQLNEKKMGEIAIENDNGTNIIFHANKKRLSEIKKIEEKQQLVKTPAPFTHRDLPTGELTTNKLLSGSKERSTVVNGSIITQNNTKKQFKLTGKYNKCQDKGIENDR